MKAPAIALSVPFTSGMTVVVTFCDEFEGFTNADPRLRSVFYRRLLASVDRLIEGVPVHLDGPRLLRGDSIAGQLVTQEGRRYVH